MNYVANKNGILFKAKCQNIILFKNYAKVSSILKSSISTWSIFGRQDAQFFAKGNHTQNKCFGILGIFLSNIFENGFNRIVGSFFPNQAYFFFHFFTDSTIWFEVIPSSGSLSIASKRESSSSSLAGLPTIAQLVSVLLMVCFSSAMLLTQLSDLRYLIISLALVALSMFTVNVVIALIYAVKIQKNKR